MLLILKGRPACGPPERVPMGGPSHGPPGHKPKLPGLREAAPCKLNNEKKRRRNRAQGASSAWKEKPCHDLLEEEGRTDLQ